MLQIFPENASRLISNCNPELLRKKHLENRFKNPIPQSIVVGLEGFSINEIE